jgi:hypothetical protein
MARVGFVFGCLVGVSALVGCSSDPVDPAATTGGAPVDKTDVVVNEISALGEDWVEIGSAAAEELDLSGLGVTDQLDDGRPKLAEAMRFPEGTKLAPGQYLLIRADLNDALPGEQTACLTTGGPATCYQATWGISDSMGDKIFLISQANEVLSEVPYPINAATAGQTYGRVPSTLGNFVACEPTPGQANKASP